MLLKWFLLYFFPTRNLNIAAHVVGSLIFGLSWGGLGLTSITLGWGPEAISKYLAKMMQVNHHQFLIFIYLEFKASMTSSITEPNQTLHSFVYTSVNVIMPMDYG